MFKLSRRSRSRIEGINPVLIEIIEEAIKTSPFDFGIPQHGGKRTAEDQNYLFLSKKSKCDGYIKKSYHQSGNAFDIYGFVEGRATWNADILESIAKHLQQVAKECFGISLRWGGDWNGNGVRVDKDKKESFFDGAHFEIKTK